MIEASLVLHEARIDPGLATICHTDRLYASAQLEGKNCLKMGLKMTSCPDEKAQQHLTQ